jgi:hypothetical protein
LHAFWALLAGGQNSLRRAYGWDTLHFHLPGRTLTSPPELTNIESRR